MAPPTSSIELFFSCTNLKDKDFIGKSDPFVVLYLKNVHVGSNWNEVDRSETIKDNLNPSFMKQFQVDYFFEEVQQYKVEVYDEDNSKSASLEEQQLIGTAEFTLGQIMGSPGQSSSYTLHNSRSSFGSKKSCGEIHIRGEEISTCTETLKIQFEAKELTNLDGFFNKSDPFLCINRVREDGSWMKVYQSETIDNNLNPTWNQFELSVQALCNGDYQRPLQLQVFDDDRNGKSELIGEVETSLRQLTEEIMAAIPLNNKERQQKKGKKYKGSGKLYVKSIDIFRRSTFLEYIRGGCEINLIVGIDYTGSNGDPHDPTSLHHFSPNELNQYQQAILSTTSILQEYDSDKRFPVYGFGGQLGGQVNHCFPLNFNVQQPEVSGVEGIMQVYSNSFQSVALSGPTLFSPLLEQACYIASQYTSQQDQKYFVLLILTDGVIMDMEQTVDTLVRASKLPLSVVVIGVGDADFSAMERLDGDDGLLRGTKGDISSRDIVQFVPYKKTVSQSVSRLTKETLAEIPRQLEKYMTNASIVPNPSRTPNISNPFATSIPPAPTSMPSQLHSEV